MNGRHQMKEILRHVYSHWPGYLFAYSLIIVLLIFMAVSAEQGWFALIPVALASMLVVAYFLASSLWIAGQVRGPKGIRPHHVLFDMARIQETDRFAYINLADRQRAMELGSRLTTGKAIIIDVYSPQLTTSRALTRRRRRGPAMPQDPRFEWRAGQINLLPLPDGSVTAVILCQALSEFWQHGDRLLLLREIHRILIPNGRLLVAERTRTGASWLLMGLAAWRLPKANKWRKLLLEAGFRVQNEREIQGLLHCYRADKPAPSEGQQLPLELRV